MSNYEMTGTIIKIAERKQISDNFTVQEFILNVPHPQYPQDIKFQASNKTLDYLKPELIGQTVKITFDIRGRGVPGKGYFNNLSAFKIEALNGQQYQQQPQQQVPPQVAQSFPDAEVVPNHPVNQSYDQAIASGEMQEDDIPF